MLPQNNIFPPFRDFSDILDVNGTTNSTTPLSPSLDRQWSNLSVNSTSTSQTKRTKKKVTLWTERHNTTVAVLGTLKSHEQFRNLLVLIKEKVGDTKSHYFREDQLCGFVYFHDDQTAEKCKQIFDGFLFDGVVLRACSPTQYFPNEDDIFPDPMTIKKTSQAAAAHYPSEPTPTLVIKNLCFGLKQNKFLEYMGRLKAVPHSVSYHYDSNGLFRGVAFAKYNTIDQATEALAELQGVQINGRAIKAEFKRRGSGGERSPPPVTRSFSDRESSNPATPPPTVPATIKLSPIGPPAFSARPFATEPPPGFPRLPLTQTVASPIIASDDDDSSDGCGSVSFSSLSPTNRTPVKGSRAVGDGIVHHQQPHAAVQTFQLFPTSPLQVRAGAGFSGLKSAVAGATMPPPQMKLFSSQHCIPILREGLEFA